MQRREAKNEKKDSERNVTKNFREFLEESRSNDVKTVKMKDGNRMEKQQKFSKRSLKKVLTLNWYAKGCQLTDSTDSKKLK